MAFALQQPSIPTTLFSTARLSELQANLELATGQSPLSAAEQGALLALQQQFFSGQAWEAVRSWSGTEVQRYWAELGRARDRLA